VEGVEIFEMGWNFKVLLSIRDARGFVTYRSTLYVFAGGKNDAGNRALAIAKREGFPVVPGGDFQADAEIF
jgi:hypothetical protein